MGFGAEEPSGSGPDGAGLGAGAVAAIACATVGAALAAAGAVAYRRRHSDPRAARALRVAGNLGHSVVRPVVAAKDGGAALLSRLSSRAPSYSTMP